MLGREKPRILCVSHSFFHLQLMRSALLSRKYEALTASTPEQAVAFCVGNNVAAVVLDSEFPTEYGWSAAQTFKIINPRLPVLLLQSGHNGDIPAGVDGVAATVALMLDKLNALLTRPA